MKIILPPHNKISQKIEFIEGKISKEDYAEAKMLRDKTNNDEFFVPGSKNNVCFAMAHPQVSSSPLRIFTIHKDQKELINYFESDIIVNARIVSKDRETRHMGKEGCMSFPFRPMVKVKRFLDIVAEYYIIDKETLEVKKIEKNLKNLPAIIFQHEIQHFAGKNIYQKK